MSDRLRELLRSSRTLQGAYKWDAEEGEPSRLKKCPAFSKLYKESAECLLELYELGSDTDTNHPDYESIK